MSRPITIPERIAAIQKLRLRVKAGDFGNAYLLVNELAITIVIPGVDSDDRIRIGESRLIALAEGYPLDEIRVVKGGLSKQYRLPKEPRKPPERQTGAGTKQRWDEERQVWR